jgi:hypothetical protein
MDQKIPINTRSFNRDIGMIIGLLFGSAFGMLMYLMTNNAIYISFCGIGLVLGLIFGSKIKKKD